MTTPRIEEMTIGEVNKDVVNFYENLGFTLVEIKSSVFRVEESTLVFQTDHKNHTVDASTILYSDAERIYTKAHQAGIDDAVEKIKNLQRWADTDGGEAGMRAEDYGGWLDRDEVLQALQDNK